MRKMPTKLALLGTGAIGSYVAEHVCSGAAGKWDVVGVFDHNPESAERVGQMLGACVAHDVQHMLDLSPDVVLETATADAVRSYAKEVLDRGIDLIVLSSGALLDERLLTEMKQLALRTGAMIYVPSGAIGGIDLVRAAAASADSSIRIRTSKPPQGLADAPYVKNLDVNLDTQAVIFSGGVRDAIRGFPKNVNVAASLALAAHDPECLRIEVEVCPDLQHNMHSITLESVFGSAEIIVRSRPMKNNPRSSLLAALSCIALLKRLQQPLQVC